MLRTSPARLRHRFVVVQLAIGISRYTAVHHSQLLEHSKACLVSLETACSLLSWTVVPVPGPRHLRSGYPKRLCPLVARHDYCRG
eukprot:10971308-Lingulodinium_polyedra.AAC.1